MSFFPRLPEFQKIETLLGSSKLTSKNSGIGDDGYLFTFKKNKWAISTDASVEGIHYNLNWCRPEEALHKAILANVSDMNAMGAETSHLFLSLGAKKSWKNREFLKFKNTLRKLEKEVGFKISGGDFTSTTSQSFFSITVIGRVSGRPLLRKNSTPGHKIYLSGPLGHSAVGLKLFENNLLLKSSKHQRLTNAAFKKEMKQSHLFPSIPFSLGPALSRLKKNIAAIDISDGLSSEMSHLTRQSKCKFDIIWEDIPRHSEMDLKLSPYWLKKLILHGGEDYQLLFTGKFTNNELKSLKTHSKIIEIGRVSQGKGVYLHKKDKRPELLIPKGYAH